MSKEKRTSLCSDRSRSSAARSGTLDRSSHQFEKEGECVPLTRKEFQLLEFFLENQGKALTRAAIMNKVWGSSLMVTQRSVDRCVTTLRAKVESAPHAPKHIKTIRDVGYRFELGER